MVLSWSRRMGNSFITHTPPSHSLVPQVMPRPIPSLLSRLGFVLFPLVTPLQPDLMAVALAAEET